MNNNMIILIAFLLNYLLTILLSIYALKSGYKIKFIYSYFIGTLTSVFGCLLYMKLSGRYKVPFIIVIDKIKQEGYWLCREDNYSYIFNILYDLMDMKTLSFKHLGGDEYVIYDPNIIDDFNFLFGSPTNEEDSERDLLTLLKILYVNIDKLKTGLCGLSRLLVIKNYITDKEEEIIVEFIENNKPKYKYIHNLYNPNKISENSLYYWKVGSIEPREKWLLKQINKLS